MRELAEMAETPGAVEKSPRQQACDGSVRAMAAAIRAWSPARMTRRRHACSSQDWRESV